MEDTGSGAASHTDRDLAPETRYVYRVQAHNANGVSVRSKFANGVTLPEPSDEPDPDDKPGTATDLGDITDLAKPVFKWSTLDGDRDVTDYYRFELSEPKQVGFWVAGAGEERRPVH